MISIIVPIYNVEAYLKSCIESILNSTVQNFELILVDDGSPDDCGTICDEYATRDNRIKVIHKPNGGLSDARNAGMKVAVGEFIVFIDSDDTIHPRMLEVLYDAINSDNYDFSMVDWCYNQGQDSINKRESSQISPLTKVLSQNDFMIGLADLGSATRQYNVVWNKMFKHSLIKGILFKNFFAEDIEWLSRVCLGFNKGIYIDEPLYHYTVRDGSIMRSDIKLRKFSETSTFYACFQNMPMDRPQYRTIWLKDVYSVLFDCRNKNKGEERITEVNALARTIYKDTKTELLHSSLSLSRKMRILCFYHFPGLYNLLYKLKFGSNKGA